jgi:poly-gamma-glutamate synthesis protein (capsule biosynthesis protein)
MMFVGDISVPAKALKAFAASPRLDLGGSAVAVLEGTLVKDDCSFARRRVVFNDLRVAEILASKGVRAVTLATNHSLDLSSNFRANREALASCGIAACGGGERATEAAEDAVLYEDAQEVRVLGFGWGPIGCRLAGSTSPGVNPLEPRNVLSCVRSVRRNHPAARLVLLMHWNYELELYPQPLHRQLAFAAIDAGADLIIGAHSHCVQGVEFYGGVPIVYCLGNWFVPQGLFFGGRLSYPQISLRQLAFEWHPQSSRVRCHWYSYDRASYALTQEESEDPSTSERVRTLTPFQGMSHQDYVQWFIRNRRKRLALPVFADMGEPRFNRYKAGWLQARQLLISAGLSLHLKRGPS